MRLDKFISKDRILDIKSNVLEGALEELLDTWTPDENVKLSKKDILNAILDREKNITTYLGNGVAVPHIKLPMKRSYVFMIGRCMNGLEYEGMEEYRELRLIVLLLAGEKESSYLKVLSSLARIFQNKDLVDQIIKAETTSSMQSLIKKGFSGVVSSINTKTTRSNKLILKSPKAWNVRV